VGVAHRPDQAARRSTQALTAVMKDLASSVVFSGNSTEEWMMRSTQSSCDLPGPTQTARKQVLIHVRASCDSFCLGHQAGCPRNEKLGKSLSLRDGG